MIGRARGGLGVAVVLAGALLAVGGGCGSGTSNTLNGSVTQTYNLAYDRVEIYQQKYNNVVVAYVVKYVYKPDSPTARRWPVIVTVKTPVAAGQEKDLLKDGELSRVMEDASSFPKMDSGRITFDDLTEVGKSVAGRFYITFQADPLKGLTVKGTLNGEFSGTLQAL